MFAGSQANMNTTKQSLQCDYKDILRLYPLLTINRSINLQVGIPYTVPFNHPCLPTPKPMHTTKLILEGPQIIINQSINLRVHR